MKYDLSEINEVIQNRRTIYPEQYSDRKVHREQVEAILGMLPGRLLMEKHNLGDSKFSWKKV